MYMFEDKMSLQTVLGGLKNIQQVNCITSHAFCHTPGLKGFRDDAVDLNFSFSNSWRE